MSLQSFVIGFFIYSVIEVFLRVGVLIYFTGVSGASWKGLTPHISMFFSPGYWISRNCKKYGPRHARPDKLRAQLILNFNLWNLVVSGIFLIFVITVRREGASLDELVVSVVAWRFISRNFEISIAFVKDITTPVRKSCLDNFHRMKLALRSYLEIFIYSAAFYGCITKCYVGAGKIFLDSLYVGTLTNVSEVAKSLVDPYWVFLQVFATLSLIILSLAGYIGKVKTTKNSRIQRWRFTYRRRHNV